MGERIDQTIDSGCAACALPVGVASAVGMQELNRTPQEYIAANAENIRDLGFKIPTIKFQKEDVQNLKFSGMDKLHNPLVAACKVVAAGNRVLPQPENRGGSFIEDVRSKRRKRIFERNGINVLPCWVVKQNSQKRLSLVVRVAPKRPAGLPVSPVTVAETNMDVRVLMRELKHVPAPVLPSKAEVESHNVLCVCPWPRTVIGPPQS